MKKLPVLLIFLLCLSLLAACTTDNNDEAVLPEISGPALVMFYTDG